MTTAMTITIRPIHSEADYTAMLEQIAGLMDAAPGSPEADRLDVLTTLVEAYEAKHFPMDPPDPIDAIRFRMEQQGLTAKDLEPFIGTSARVSEVLNRRRALSLAMIRRLTEGLGIPAEVLIRPTGAPSARKTPEASRSGRRGATKRATSKGAARGAREWGAKRGEANRGRAKSGVRKRGTKGDASKRTTRGREQPVPA